MLDRRTNEWLGSGRHSRYLFSWSELRLINKHRQLIAWGRERQAKEALLAASQRRFYSLYAAQGLGLLLVIIGWFGWYSNSWQTWLIKRDLRSYGSSLSDNDALSAIAQAFAYAEDSPQALRVLNQISDDRYKASALGAIAESYARLVESSNDRALYDQTFRFIEGLDSDDSGDKVLQSILSTKLAVADVSRLRALASHFSSDAGKAQALARILMAVSHPELIGKEKEVEADDER